jgi:TRAP-type mannitol/chloroaromatic compound transport system permease small subunit
VIPPASGQLFVLDDATRIADWIDRLTGAVGRAVAWLAVAIVLAQFAVVVMRYGLGIGSIWMQESILYAHAVLFLLAAAWTLASDGHARIDILYANASPRRRALVDLCGALLLLLPFMAVLAWYAWPYVARSWAIYERSQEVSGLPFVFLLKSVLLLFALLMALQGIAQAIRAWAVLRRA